MLHRRPAVHKVDGEVDEHDGAREGGGGVVRGHRVQVARVARRVEGGADAAREGAVVRLEGRRV